MWWTLFCPTPERLWCGIYDGVTLMRALKCATFKIHTEFIRESIKGTELISASSLQSRLQPSRSRGTWRRLRAHAPFSPAASSARSVSTWPGWEEAATPAWVHRWTSWTTCLCSCRPWPRISPAGTSASPRTKEAPPRGRSTWLCKVGKLHWNRHWKSKFQV